MQAMEVARKLAELGQSKEACQAYKLALNDGDNTDRMEAAIYILQFGGVDDYKIAYSCFVDLYKQGFAQDDILAIMDGAFYQPNVKRLQKRYEKNCRLLSKYSYIFRKDFLAFDELPIIFFPYDDNQYTPYFLQKQKFGDYLNFRHEVISRNFFRDLDKPILAADVFSQYELEYLNDNVRKSEWVARGNHIYLYYTSWSVFCAYLQVLDLQVLLKDKKIVFLIEDEIEQYPIDFKERFGIDYSQYEVRPIGIREINRLIWHTQLSSHNGGDFFNEIFDAHPNLLCRPSLMLDDVDAQIKEIKRALIKASNLEIAHKMLPWSNPQIITHLYNLRDRTEKDIMVATFLNAQKKTSPNLDFNSRIVPTIFFQPHFGNIKYQFQITSQGCVKLFSEHYEKIRKSPMFNGFKYIKTFTPMRRSTTSYGASVKFQMAHYKDDVYRVLDDATFNHVLNRSFMIDWQDKLFKDSVLVRLEDGKLNPKATFTALAAFLDLPYTESMTYCSLYGERDPESLAGNDIGFSPAAIYRTYDDYATDDERSFIEYFMRDAYEYYGYDFKYYDGSSVDVEWVDKLLSEFDKIDGFMCKTLERSLSIRISEDNTTLDIPKDNFVEEYINDIRENRHQAANILMRGLNFVNKNGQPLHMMPLLKLDPELLEQPLYR